MDNAGQRPHKRARIEEEDDDDGFTLLDIPLEILVSILRYSVEEFVDTDIDYFRLDRPTLLAITLTSSYLGWTVVPLIQWKGHHARTFRWKTGEECFFCRKTGEYEKFVPSLWKWICSKCIELRNANALIESCHRGAIESLDECRCGNRYLCYLCIKDPHILGVGSNEHRINRIHAVCQHIACPHPVDDPELGNKCALCNHRFCSMHSVRTKCGEHKESLCYGCFKKITGILNKGDKTSWMVRSAIGESINLYHQ